MRNLRLLILSLVFAAATIVAAENRHDTAPSTTAQPRQAAPSKASEPVVVWGRTLVGYRVSMEFIDTQQRARAAEARIDRALGEIEADKIVIKPMQIGDERGMVISTGSRFLLKIMDGDLDPESDEKLETVAEKAASELRALVRDHAEQHTWSLLVSAIVKAVTASVLFALFWMLVAWVKSKLLQRLLDRNREGRNKLVLFGYDWHPMMQGIIEAVLRVVMLTVILAGAYMWITYVLGRFPYTRHWSEQLGTYLFSTLSYLTAGAVRQIPDLIVLVIIYVFTRAIIRLLNSWFLAVESGKHLTSVLDPEAARATRRLVGIGVWIFALVVAFPYLPGSHSEAFKGISVFLGLMLSLGGASFVGQIIGGIAAVYSRSVRSGDFIVVGEIQGTVKELGLFTTKIITRNREEVTIPNSMLISTAIRNSSRIGKNSTQLSTAVTIGYDTPWRQVHALLLGAVAKTETILKDPAPFVQQTALDDFYVRYELTAYVRSGAERAPSLASLHAAIQDAFNEHGVQIMSPHFFDQPAQPVVVPKDRWHAAPAKPPQ